jgi:flagellar secretion chaperone FliS
MKSMVDARRSYQESAIRGATPIELVVVLYDSAIEDMRRALAAMQQNDVETRCRQMAHALIVLQQLQGTLDFERGGSSARQFEQFYSLVRAKLLEAQIRNSPETLREQIRYCSEVRDCWVEAKRIMQPVGNAGAATMSSVAPESGSASSGWSA